MALLRIFSLFAATLALLGARQPPARAPTASDHDDLSTLGDLATSRPHCLESDPQQLQQPATMLWTVEAATLVHAPVLADLIAHVAPLPARACAYLYTCSGTDPPIAHS